MQNYFTGPFKFTFVRHPIRLNIFIKSYSFFFSFQAEFMNARQRGAHVAPLQQVGHEHLEEQNDEEEKLLSKSVSALKSLSIDIGTEIRDQVRARHMFSRIL